MAEQGYTLTRQAIEDLRQLKREVQLLQHGRTPMRRRRRNESAETQGGGVPVKITGVHPDSPTGESDVRIFRGYVYANGTEAVPSKPGVTIRIMDLAPDISDYPNWALLATPISETWIKSDTTTITETVYHVQEKLYWG